MAASNQYSFQRRRMVSEQIARRGITDEKLLAVFNEIPRHLFVPEGLWNQAYEDHPVSIGEGQTISQPYIVALMTDALGLNGKEKVLEIGTGSGYQTAILAKRADWVFSIERIASLSRMATSALEKCRIFNCNLIVSDGTLGYPDEAPYDAIIVTAGGPEIPKPLVAQLAEGGRLVIPVGDRYHQSLMRVTRRGDETITEDLGGCRFVDLIGRHGWKR